MRKIQAQALKNETDEAPRRRHPLLFGVGLAGFLMFAYSGYLAQQLMDPDAYPIRKIAVEGEFDHLAVEHVERLVSQAVDGGFFSVDVAEVRRRILDEPWIFDASVRRVWPDTIRVAITEQRPVARWGAYGVLNEYADIFAPEDVEELTGLVVLEGPIGTEFELLRRYVEIQHGLKTLGLTVSRLALSERRAWSLELRDGAVVVIGRNALEERLRRFRRSYVTTLQPNWDRIELVDLRYTNGFAIKEKSTVDSNG